MKPLEEFQNADKLKLLHQLFPKEIPALLDHIQLFSQHFFDNQQAYAKDWGSGFVPFNFWLSLSQQAATLIKKCRLDMVKSSRVFADQLTFDYTVMFVNDRIVKYAQTQSSNEKFKLMVQVLFD